VELQLLPFVLVLVVLVLVPPVLRLRLRVLRVLRGLLFWLRPPPSSPPFLCSSVAWSSVESWFKKKKLGYQRNWPIGAFFLPSVDW
jgi:hypothetical protein